MESRTMKDSGVEWIGEVPETWQINRVKRIGRYINGYAFKPDDWKSEGKPIIRIQNLSKRNNNYNYYEGELDDKYKVLKGDYLISWSATLDVYEWYGPEAYLNQHIFKAIPDLSIVTERFFFWLAKYFIVEMDNSKHGSAMKHVTKSVFDNFKIPLPDLIEQQKIASFLDEKVAHIDNILEDTKKSIEYLKAYKKSLITETVTKGLNANVEMKDSGIEWIGEIPKHWNSAFLGQYFRQVKDKNKDLQEINLLSLSYGNIIQKDINTKDGLLPESFEGYNIIKKNDIVLRMTDLQNDKTSLRVGHATQSGIITSAYISIRLYNKFDSKYAYYFFHSFDIYKGFYGMGSGVRQNVTFNMLKKMQMLVPPIEDQKRIVDFIETKTCLIDNLIKNKAKMLQEIEAYKKSLIYEYVTGKKEVK